MLYHTVGMRAGEGPDPSHVTFVTYGGCQCCAKHRYTNTRIVPFSVPEIFCVCWGASEGPSVVLGESKL